VRALATKFGTPALTASYSPRGQAARGIMWV